MTAIKTTTTKKQSIITVFMSDSHQPKYKNIKQKKSTRNVLSCSQATQCKIREQYWCRVIEVCVSKINLFFVLDAQWTNYGRKSISCYGSMCRWLSSYTIHTYGCWPTAVRHSSDRHRFNACMRSERDSNVCHALRYGFGHAKRSHIRYLSLYTFLLHKTTVKLLLIVH